MAAMRCVALVCVVFALIGENVSATRQAIGSGDLLFLSGNTLLAISPKGVKRASIKLVSSKPGPIDLDSFPADGKRPIEDVFPGSVSHDGRYAFNTANFNRPVNKNTSDDAAYLIVTDLLKAKVKHRIRIPLPGLPAGTNFNFQSDFFTPADQGDIEANLGYKARNYLAVGDTLKGEYPLFIILSAWSCKDRNKKTGEPNKEQLYTKYTYNARTGALKWSGIRQTISSECKGGKGLLDGEAAYAGRGLSAVGSTGYLIAGNLLNGGPGELAIYELVGEKLKAIFKKPQSDTSDYFDLLTLINADPKGKTAKVAGVTVRYANSVGTAQVRTFGIYKSKAVPSSPLTRQRFKPNEVVTAMAGADGGLYGLTVQSGPKGFSKKLTVVYLGTFNGLTDGPKGTPTLDFKRMFQLPAEYSGSLLVVGNPSPSR